MRNTLIHSHDQKIRTLLNESFFASAMLVGAVVLIIVVASFALMK